LLYGFFGAGQRRALAAWQRNKGILWHAGLP
jgi:hypothetical protein